MDNINEVINFINNESFNISEIESYIEKDNFLDDIILYIDCILIPSIKAPVEVELEYMTIIYVKESFDLIKKLSRAFGWLNMNHLAIPDKEIKWFATDNTFKKKIDGEGEREGEREGEGEGEGEGERTIEKSKILTILTHLIITMNEYYETNIINLEKKMTMVLSYIFPNFSGKFTIENEEYKLILEEYKTLWELSRTTHQHYISLFSSIECMEEKDKHLYLINLPETILSIYVSSMRFIHNDNKFFDVINASIKNNSFIPTEYRAKYITFILRLYYEEKKEIIFNEFNPDIEILMNDIINLFPKYLSDPIYMSDMYSITNIINIYYKTPNSDLISLENMIRYVSIQLYSVSKIENVYEIFSNDKMKFVGLIKFYIENINLILKDSGKILDSYLIYYLISTINNVITNKMDLLESLSDNIRETFKFIIENKYGLKYMASIAEDYPYLELSLEEKAKLAEYVKEFAETDNCDAITQLPIVIPFTLPPDQKCDKYMLESYVWLKEENPFTRNKLTLKDFPDLESI